MTAVLISFLLLPGYDSGKQTEDIYIIYTNDVASAIDENFGYAGVKGYKDKLKEEHKYVALVDAGDYFDGKLASESEGEDIVKLMNAVGYDVVTLGNQEFSLGLTALRKDIRKSRFSYVSCNIRYTGNKRNMLKRVRPYVIKRYGPIKVAFIGVTTPETLTPGKKAYVACLENGEVAYDFYQSDGGPELYEQVQKTVDKIRNKVDYVIVLAHLGSNNVAEGFSSYDLIRNTRGIDAVIDGHSHTPILGEPVLNLDGEDVALTSTGQKFQNLGVMVLRSDHTIFTNLHQTIYESDEKIEKMVEEIRARSNTVQ